MEEEKKYHNINTTELRNELKNILAKEIQKLPENLAKLHNKQRVDVLLKLLPFVFPKVDTVQYEQGESTEFKTVIFK